MPLTIRDGTIDGPVQFEPAGQSLIGPRRHSVAAIVRLCRSGHPRSRSPPWCMHRPMSALERITDSSQTSRHVRKVPTTDSRSAANKSHHSITSSARAKRVGGIVSPSALAVIRLMTSSTLVLCWIGRSAGLAPLRIFPT